MSYLFNVASLVDIEQIFHITDYFYRQKTILFKSFADIERDVSSYIVCKNELSEILGCGYLHFYDIQLVEIRSLVVKEDHQHQGIGKNIVLQLIDLAKKRKHSKIFTLTREVDFFLKLFFKKTNIDSLPEKILKDCIGCSSYPACGETALIYECK